MVVLKYEGRSRRGAVTSYFSRRMSARSVRRKVVCPFCGETIPASSKACPFCGSDERTGWSDGTYLDGIDLPDDDSYEEMMRREFGGTGVPSGRGIKLWVYLVALGLLAVAGYGLLRAVWQ